MPAPTTTFQCAIPPVTLVLPATRNPFRAPPLPQQTRQQTSGGAMYTVSRGDARKSFELTFLRLTVAQYQALESFITNTLAYSAHPCTITLHTGDTFTDMYYWEGIGSAALYRGDRRDVTLEFRQGAPPAPRIEKNIVPNPRMISTGTPVPTHTPGWTLDQYAVYGSTITLGAADSPWGVGVDVIQYQYENGDWDPIFGPPVTGDVAPTPLPVYDMDVRVQVVFRRTAGTLLNRLRVAFYSTPTAPLAGADFDTTLWTDAGAASSDWETISATLAASAMPVRAVYFQPIFDFGSNIGNTAAPTTFQVAEITAYYTL